MPHITKKDIERVFRVSGSPDELFDTFRIAIDRKINDAALYRMLLWNKALSPDEIMMYAEKICKEHPGLCYQIYFWVGKIFSSASVYGEYLERAFEYFKKACLSDPRAYEPLAAIARLYSHELNVPKLGRIVRTLENGLNTVALPSKVCLALAKLYKRTGDKESEQAYQRLGEKFQKEGR